MLKDHEGTRSRRSLAVCAGLFGSMLSLAACASGVSDQVALNPSDFGVPDAVTAVTQGEHLLGSLDKIRVTVFQEPALSGEFQVDQGGKIDLPQVGAVEAKGRTTAQLATHLKERLSQRLLRNPNVQVALVEAAEQNVTIDGAVRKPGVVAIRGQTTLIRAIALAEGTMPEANPKRVLVFRTVNGQRMAAAYDLHAIRQAAAPDPVIYGNDVVVVPGSRTRGILRDILSTVPVLGVFRPF